MNGSWALRFLLFALAPILSASEGSFNLGGPCVDVVGYPPGFHTELRESLAEGDWERVIELQKQSVRAMCSNDYRWLELADAYALVARPDVAIEILTELHRKGAEIKPETLKYQEKLTELIDTPEFQKTNLGRELKELQIAAARRRDDFHSRLAALDPPARPPDRYVAEGACPFECCTFREWDVKETTPLYDRPLGSVVVGSAPEGSRVLGVTGEVHLRPAPIAVIHDRPPFARGEILFALDYLGEGFYKYWRNGEVASNDLAIEELCLRPTPKCWAEYIQPPESREEPRWWVLIETDAGLRGWTDRSQHFGNMDACG